MPSLPLFAPSECFLFRQDSAVPATGRGRRSMKWTETVVAFVIIVIIICTVSHRTGCKEENGRVRVAKDSASGQNVSCSQEVNCHPNTGPEGRGPSRSAAPASEFPGPLDHMSTLAVGGYMTRQQDPRATEAPQPEQRGQRWCLAT